MQKEPGSSPSEIIYGSSGSPTLDEHRAMSNKVMNMASAIHKELEHMIQKHGEEGVKTLMPLVVSVLESLDTAYVERDVYAADNEILKEDNEQLLNQFEREKALRKQAETKFMEIEDVMIGEKKELEKKIESLESIMRMLELKAKNASDHSNRLEEREVEMKTEFDKLHERYNTLLRTHVDHMERTKYLMGTEKYEMMQNMPLPTNQLRTRMGMTSSVDASGIRGVSDLISAHMTQSTTMDVNLANHISNEADWQDEFTSDVEPSPRDIIEEVTPQPEAVDEKVSTSKEEATDAPKDEERESEDALGADLTGNLVDPAEFASADLDGLGSCEDLFNPRTTSEDSDDPLVNDTFVGMGREVENLIKENTELLDMKNALNIVKNDLIARVDELSSESEILRDEIRSLEMVRIKMSDAMEKMETELKDTKQRLSEKEADEEDVPMAQKKRFTRAEMQRVLMDRNAYKERLMELEESIKWTELQRAKKMQQQHPTTQKKTGIWDFFSGLFASDSLSPTQPRRAGVRGDARRGGPMTRSVEYLDPDMISERRTAERREQYKMVREHMRRDDNGRVEAYGWSLPVIESSPSSPMVPVPVCCRPLMENQPSLKVWCSAGVILRGGKAADGSFLIGEPVYFSPGVKKVPKDTVVEDQLETAISRARALDALESELSEWESSSLVWVGSSNMGRSHVAVLDANNPNNVIEAFEACDSHLLCMLGVPGVLETDPMINEAESKRMLSGGGKMKDIPEDSGIDEGAELGAVEWVELRKMEDEEDDVTTYCSHELKPSPKRTRDFSVSEAAVVAGSSAPEATVEQAQEAEELTPPTQPAARLIPLEKYAQNNEPLPPPRVGRAALPPHVRDAMAKYDELGSAIKTALPTVWMGSQNQYIYVHSAISDWRKCMRRIKLPDAVLSLVHYRGRVFAALANGTIAVFHRDKTGEWWDVGYHSIRIGKVVSSVRSLCVVAGNIWAAYKNCVVVIDSDSLQIVKIFSAHPRKDSQVRNMQWVGAGVWLSIRLDSTLRLFHAHTFEHLQDVDIEPYVTNMLGTSRLDFSYMRTTALLVSNRRLWIGTGTGVIISVPLSNKLEQKVETTDSKRPPGPGGLVRVYAKDAPKTEEPSGGYIPYCNLTHAQLSFHGHKDSVKFFLAVPGGPGPNDESSEVRKMLVFSGGDGYIDFRQGEEEPSPDKPKGARDMSHLIIWEVDADLVVLSK